MQVEPFLAAITEQMQPTGRALHQAGMLRHLLPTLPAEIQLSDLRVGWQLLGQPPQEPEPAPVTHRRNDCRELAALAAPFTPEAGHLARAVQAWQVWHQTCQQSADPRLVVMGKTFAREVSELQAAVR